MHSYKHIFAGRSREFKKIQASMQSPSSLSPLAHRRRRSAFQPGLSLHICAYIYVINLRFSSSICVPLQLCISVFSSPLSPCHYLCLYQCPHLCLSISVSISVPISVSLSLSLSVSPSLSLYLCLYLFLYLCLYLCLCLCLCLYLCVCVCVKVCVCVCDCVSLSACCCRKV